MRPWTTLGVLSDVPKKIRKERIPLLLSQVNLDDCRNLRVRALSGGMRRRLGIAQAILHDPQVLIVDEPTAGLDPEERVRFRNLLCEIAKDRIVLLSTHIVEDIEKTCKNIAILNEGRIVYSGTLADYIGEEDRPGSRLHEKDGRAWLMVRALFFKECRQVLKSILYWVFLGVILVFYATQMGMDFAGNDIREAKQSTVYNFSNPLMEPPRGTGELWNPQRGDPGTGHARRHIPLMGGVFRKQICLLSDWLL